MDFSLTAEQVALRDGLRDVLAASPSWESLADLGLFGLLVAQEAGGLGMSEVDLVTLLGEVGYAGLAEPVAETIVAAALDPSLAAGQAKVALDADVVHYGRDADRLLVLEPRAVRLASAGARTDVETVDTTLRAARVVPGEGEVVASASTLTRRRLWLATAALQLGLARRMLDLSTAYVTTRHQFGVPVGSFQAVKHTIANAFRDLEFAAPSVLAAGFDLARGAETAGRSVSLAVVLATEAATGMARAAIQSHGAIGYTVEYELHRYAKRSWALAATIDIDRHLDALAIALDLKGAPS